MGGMWMIFVDSLPLEAFAHCPLPTAHSPLPTAHCPPLTAHCPPPTDSKRRFFFRNGFPLDFRLGRWGQKHFGEA